MAFPGRAEQGKNLWFYGLKKIIVILLVFRGNFILFSGINET